MQELLSNIRALLNHSLLLTVIVLPCKKLYSEYQPIGYCATEQSSG